MNTSPLKSATVRAGVRAHGSESEAMRRSFIASKVKCALGSSEVSQYSHEPIMARRCGGLEREVQSYRSRSAGLVGCDSKFQSVGMEWVKFSRERWGQALE